MYGALKEREASKNSRSSQRRTSNNTGNSPKNTAIKPQLGKDKLTRLLQPSTPSAKLLLGPDMESKAKGYIGGSSKRKNSSTSSLKRAQADSRPSIAGKSSSKHIMPSPTHATSSYLSTKSPMDPKKEILKTKLGLAEVKKKKDETRLSPKTSPNPLGLASFITQVAMPTVPRPDTPTRGGSHTDKTKGKKKKKLLPSVEVKPLLTLRHTGVFYMQKLELAFIKCGSDSESLLFRQHFQQTIQNLSLLGKASSWVEPVEEKIKASMPTLRKPSNHFIN